MNDYIRIGTDYYKMAQQPLHSGDKMNVLLKWKKGEIITDLGKDALDDVERYDGFCLIPSNSKYQQTIDGFYNKYERIQMELKQGEFPKTIKFLKHIFGEQYDIGLDFITILWQKPTQILPILCLVSADRKTGKTTFLNWLKLIFQGNMTINANEDFRSRFNSDWSSKLIVAVDEVLLDKKEDSERIKNLSTASSYKTESKGVDKSESYFFGKFILCSNNETNFIQVDKDEIRYWVRKVDSINDNDENPNLLDDLKKEIPYFTHHLNNRKIQSKRKSRMWFTKNEIFTEALSRLVNGNRTYLHKEIAQILIDDFIKYELDVLKYTAGDLLEKLIANNTRASAFQISDVLKNHFGLESTNGSYYRYYLTQSPNDSNHSISKLNNKGRYFTFKKEKFQE
ncbi:primase-helicase family protein [Psychroserpens burtonensis]|uniref:primase-helicase family protein n=1 Tax=Psychroserpens burtonensis TaxID=49278 RepID=UPI00041BA5E3|nr:primase-helicase family protein [Psychroserpens burtonensis]